MRIVFVLLLAAFLIPSSTFAQSTKEFKARGYKSESAMIAHAKDRCPKLRKLVLQGQCIGVAGCDQYGGPTEQEVQKACKPSAPPVIVIPPK